MLRLYIHNNTYIHARSLKNISRTVYMTRIIVKKQKLSSMNVKEQIEYMYIHTFV